VQYGRLLDIGRDYLHNHRQRPLPARLHRYALRKILSNKKLSSFLTRIINPIRMWLPGNYKKLFASAGIKTSWPQNTHTRRVIILDGCVQPSLAPDINAACARLLNKISIQTIRVRKDACCGAVNLHMDAIEDARRQMRHNIDIWWPYISTGTEAIISTASACGLMLKDYAYALKDDPAYADKAVRISALSRDISEVIAEADISALRVNSGKRIAWQSPCTLQHGQKITGLVEKILQDCGYTLSTVADPHLCCGSAGTYSVLQADISQQLLARKLEGLQSDAPEIIATANIGCLLHLRSKSNVPVMHWLQLLDRQVAE
jgi:glycolate oxidase iron-sulfur subunit